METTARHSPTPSPFALLLVRWVALAAAFAFTAWVLNGVDITGGFWAYVWVALIFGVVNAIIGTILRILTLPFNLITLGLISLLITAVLLDHGRVDGPPDDRRLLLDDDLGGHHPRHRGGGGGADPAADLLEGAGRRGVAAGQSSRSRRPEGRGRRPRARARPPRPRTPPPGPQEVARRLPRRHRVVRAPVDRHGDARPDERERLGCSPRVEVSRAEGRAPAPDRDERHVGFGRSVRRARGRGPCRPGSRCAWSR